MRPSAHAVPLAFAAVLGAAVPGMLVASPALAQHRGRGHTAAKPDDLARARALDKEGAKAYAAGRYADAIKHFEEAHRLGGPPFELWNVAKCYLRLDQAEKAAEMLERYLATPNLPKEDREEATSQLDALKKRPSMLTVTSTPSGATVSVDGKPADSPTPVTMSVPSGPHTVTVSSATSAPFTRQIEARFGQPITVDTTETPASAPVDARPPPPPNPYLDEDGGRIMIRGAFGIALARHGSVGGKAGPGFLVHGGVRVAQAGKIAIGLGGLVAIAGDSWSNRTGEANQAVGCGALTGAQSATAFSAFGIGTGTFRAGSSLRLIGLAGLGIAAYPMENAGGDVFFPTCRASPGVRPAMMLGAELDYVVTPSVRLAIFPLTLQVQPAFDGARSIPRDASSAWLRLGIGVGGGVDF